MIYHLKLLINETAHKIKKVLLFIMKQSIKMLETGLLLHLYNSKKSYTNGNSGLFFKYFYYK